MFNWYILNINGVFNKIIVFYFLKKERKENILRKKLNDCL